MFPATRFRKTLLVIGGSGELGKVITARFAKPLFKRWNVFNVDAVANPDATHNFIVDLEK
jgi:nucleoside-diphosphate-sugar epimerase